MLRCGPWVALACGAVFAALACTPLERAQSVPPASEPPAQTAAQIGPDWATAEMKPPASMAGSDWTALLHSPAVVENTSATSALLRTYYGRLQADLVGRGLLRTDGGRNVIYSAEDLARTFLQIAFFNEYNTEGESLRAVTEAAPLRRWETPVRIAYAFGATVPDETRNHDASKIERYVARLAAITGHPISTVSEQPNMVVLVVNEHDRIAMLAEIEAFLPGLSPASRANLQSMPRDQHCAVIGTFHPDGVTYTRVLAIIRAEHPDLHREACLHEELAQGLGLANDSPFARPSIFNDDQEFAFLTGMDEEMLRILYDPRLRPGMSAEQAAPVIMQIASELRATNSI